MLPQPHRLYPYAATAFICKGDNESLTGLCYEIYRARVASAVSLATTLELDIFSSTTANGHSCLLLLPHHFSCLSILDQCCFVIYWSLTLMIYMIEYDPTRELVELKPLPERGQNFRIWSDHIRAVRGEKFSMLEQDSEIEVLKTLKKACLFYMNGPVSPVMILDIFALNWIKEPKLMKLISRCPQEALNITPTRSLGGCYYYYYWKYVNEEEKFSSTGTGTNCNFIHPSAVVHPNAILDWDPKKSMLYPRRDPWPGKRLRCLLYPRRDPWPGKRLRCLLHSILLSIGVSIGPFCTVGPSAKLGNACRLYPASHVSGKTELGDNCILMMGAVVGDELPGHTLIGCNNIIGHHAVVGIKCQDMKYKPGSECFLQIGDNNEIREYASVHRSSLPNERTIIGDNNLIMGSCHIAHDCKVGNNNIFANNTLLAGHVVVEDFTHTAGATVIHQFCHIGSFSFIGGGSVVSQDVPKYTMVSGERAELRGLNLEGLRRRGFSVVEVKSLRAAYRKIFMPADGNFRSIEDRLTELEKDEKLNGVPAVCFLLQSIRDSFAEERRGICKFRSWAGS
ncbi:UNVERIFIED_CONTAM: putative acyl-[acyl-carrier-protein]--UDP-N-acetylglucosamine O-acyltransferase, mitochondrial [Sesamum radiatum]|uniref:Acyl-[acyl-carrier-protein]--UDP-N-acetylglucosamine O-acyltransferase, mitochondrial n=1 Tax=Sesamum radiatum TaxID=300843 RepID=A0AAW2KS91_SESRA